jgi:hypothetical protein
MKHRVDAVEQWPNSFEMPNVPLHQGHPLISQSGCQIVTRATCHVINDHYLSWVAALQQLVDNRGADQSCTARYQHAFPAQIH